MGGMETRQILNDAIQIETAENAGREKIAALKKSFHFDRIDDLSKHIARAMFEAFMSGFRQGVKQCCDPKTAMKDRFLNGERMTRQDIELAMGISLPDGFSSPATFQDVEKFLSLPSHFQTSPIGTFTSIGVQPVPEMIEDAVLSPTNLYAELTEEPATKSYASVESEAEFFRKSILAD